MTTDCFRRGIAAALRYDKSIALAPPSTNRLARHDRQSRVVVSTTGAIKELLKEARRVKGSNPPNWTGNKPVKYG